MNRKKIMITQIKHIGFQTKQGVIESPVPEFPTQPPTVLTIYYFIFLLQMFYTYAPACSDLSRSLIKIFLKARKTRHHLA